MNVSFIVTDFLQDEQYIYIFLNKENVNLI